MTSPQPSPKGEGAGVGLCILATFLASQAAEPSGVQNNS